VRSTIRVAGLVALASLGLPWLAAAQESSPSHPSSEPGPPPSSAAPLPADPSPVAISPSAQSPAAQPPAGPSRVAPVTGSESPTAPSATAPSPRRKTRRYPIRESIDRAIDAVLLAHEKPCEWAKMMNVPCFPVSVEQEGPRFSVAEALRLYRGTGAPAPGVPTVAETQHQLSGAPLSASGGVGGDPVCTTKNLVRKISGKNTTFHLYRMWDARGERPLLTDRVLDPKTYAAYLDVHYEYMGQFDGECDAVAAWRKALRKATEKEPLPDDWDEVKADEAPRAETPPAPPPPE
jgi:hypothetical protein